MATRRCAGPANLVRWYAHEVGDGQAASRARGPLGASEVARARVTMRADTAARVAANELAKGDVLSTARFAGVHAARESASLVPSIGVGPVPDVALHLEVGDSCVDVVASASADAAAHGLVAVTVAALTVYDMCKAVDRTMTVDIDAVGVPGD